MNRRFHSHEVVQLTGITARQLQWWDEQGIVVPAREGHCRVYSEADLAEVAVICQLRKKGFSLQRVRKVMRLLQQNFGKRLAQRLEFPGNTQGLSVGGDLQNRGGCGWHSNQAARFSGGRSSA